MRERTWAGDPNCGPVFSSPLCASLLVALLPRDAQGSQSKPIDARRPGRTKGPVPASRIAGPHCLPTLRNKRSGGIAPPPRPASSLSRHVRTRTPRSRLDSLSHAPAQVVAPAGQADRRRSPKAAHIPSSFLGKALAHVGPMHSQSAQLGSRSAHTWWTSGEVLPTADRFRPCPTELLGCAPPNFGHLRPGLAGFNKLWG